MIEAILLAISCRLGGSKLKWSGLYLYSLIYSFHVFSIHGFILGLLSQVWVYAWKITGHADGFRDYERDNFLSPLVVFITSPFGIDRNSKTYDSVFWVIKGCLIVLLPSILLGNIFILLTGTFGYAIAYYISYEYLGMTKDSNAMYVYNQAPRLKLPKCLWFEPLFWAETLSGFFVGLGFLFL